MNETTQLSIEEVKNMLSLAKSEDEWNQTCDVIKKHFSGFPSWWFKEIILSGFVYTVSSKFMSYFKIHKLVKKCQM
jgi:hypothetical protein